MQTLGAFESNAQETGSSQVKMATTSRIRRAAEVTIGLGRRLMRMICSNDGSNNEKEAAIIIRVMFFVTLPLLLQKLSLWYVGVKVAQPFSSPSCFNTDVHDASENPISCI